MTVRSEERTVIVTRMTSLKDLMLAVSELAEPGSAHLDLSGIEPGTKVSQSLMACLANHIAIEPAKVLSIKLAQQGVASSRARRAGFDVLADLLGVSRESDAHVQLGLREDDNPSELLPDGGLLFRQPQRYATSDWSYAATSIAAKASLAASRAKVSGASLLATNRAVFELAENLSHAGLSAEGFSYVLVDVGEGNCSVTAVDTGVGLLGSLSARAPEVLSRRDDSLEAIFRGEYTYGSLRGRGLMALAGLAGELGGVIDCFTCEDRLRVSALRYSGGIVEQVEGIALQGTVVTVTIPI